MLYTAVVGAMFMCTVVQICHGLDVAVDSNKPIAQPDKALAKSQPSTVPLAWKCEIDQLKEQGHVLDTCEDWAVDEEEFYVTHGGACNVTIIDPISDTVNVKLVLCQFGRWSTGTDASLDSLNVRRRRLSEGDKIAISIFTFGIGALVACIGGIWGWCREPMKQPEFTFCPSFDIAPIYTPYDSDTVKLKWPEPSANDEDGRIKSIKHVEGPKSGTSFKGSAPGINYVIVYKATDNDGLDATCSFSFTVKVRTCGSLPSPPSHGHKKGECTKKNILGSTCTMECDKGYKPSSSFTTTCKGSNPKWTKTTECNKISCGNGPPLKNGYWECKDGLTFGSSCNIKCNKGYDPKGNTRSRCQDNGHWTSVDTRCKDVTPPKISCKTIQTYYADKGLPSTSVNWSIPTATDNSGIAPEITQTTSVVYGSRYEGKLPPVKYTATDTENNKDKCTIVIEVKAIECDSPLENLTYNGISVIPKCSQDRYLYGVSCNVSCGINLQFEGSRQIVCDSNDKNEGYWHWGNEGKPRCKFVECPALDPPENGALINDTIRNSPIVIMLCHEGFDIPALKNNFNGLLRCLDTEKWFPYETVPDCTESKSRRGFRLPSKFFYYDGICGVNDTILDNVNEIVSKLDTLLPDLCPPGTNCLVNNPVKTCGPVTDRKTRSLYSKERLPARIYESDTHQIHRRQVAADVLIISFDILTDFAKLNMTNAEEFDYYLDEIQLPKLKPAIKEKLRNGLFDIRGWSVREDSFQTDGYGTPYCDPGSVLMINDNCNLCPRGFQEENGECEECQIGHYSNVSGAADCWACPEGFSTRTIASKSLDNCTQLCTQGTYSVDMFVPCTVCKPGYYQPLVGQTSCIECPAAMSTWTAGSIRSSVCQYFDVLVANTESIDEELPFLNSAGLSFFVKADLGTANATMRVHDQFDLKLTENITIVTTSDELALGPLSTNNWVHVAVSWSVSSGMIAAFYRGSLVGNISTTNEADTKYGNLRISAKNGVLISGFRLQASVLAAGDVENATCQTVDDTDIVTMDNFRNKTDQGVRLIVPSLCDAIDECASSPCGSNGSCSNNIGSFTCTCFWGWSGVTCDIPPDFCIENDCINGATCVSTAVSYTCQCQLGYSGVFCEMPPVDGGWSEWSVGTDCTVTCEGGTRGRNRSCDNPVPGQHGQHCTGDGVQLEECNSSPCPECPELERGFAASLICDKDNNTSTLLCNATCKPGYKRPHSLAVDTYSCGKYTGYRWVPMSSVPACTRPQRTKRYSIQFKGIYTETIRPGDRNSVEAAIKSKTAGADCYKSSACESTVSLDKRSDRGKRSTGSSVTVTFSIAMNDTSELLIDQLVQNGTVSPGLQEMIDAVTNLQSTAMAINASAGSYFDVETDDVSYTVDSLGVNGAIECTEGLVGTDGFCTECPAGSRQASDYCSPCDKGTYQNLKGQSHCEQCPPGYTTKAIGSTYSTQCFVLCPAGSYKAGDLCWLCDKGTYQDVAEQTSCEECPDDFTTVTVGAVSIDDCSVSLGAHSTPVDDKEVVCPPGSYLTDDYCSLCEKGSYQDRPGQSVCVSCPTGFSTGLVGSHSSADCTVMCPAGSYRTDDHCSPCEPGTFQAQSGQVSCVGCPPGYTTETSASKSADNCYIPTTSKSTTVQSTAQLTSPTIPGNDDVITLTTAPVVTDGLTTTEKEQVTESGPPTATVETTGEAWTALRMRIMVRVNGILRPPFRQSIANTHSRPGRHDRTRYNRGAPDRFDSITTVDHPHRGYIQEPGPSTGNEGPGGPFAESAGNDHETSKTIVLYTSLALLAAGCIVCTTWITLCVRKRLVDRATQHMTQSDLETDAGVTSK